MAELKEGVERIIEVHDRSELVGAIKQAVRSGGRIDVDQRIRLKPYEMTYATMRAGLFSPRAGYIGPERHLEIKDGTVRGVTYAAGHYAPVIPIT